MKTSATMLLAMLALLALPRLGSPARASDPQQDQIQDVVRAHLDEVQRCYEQALAVDPTLRAKVVVDLTIGSDGAVTNSAIGAGTNAPVELGQCMTTAARTWQFPAHGNTVAVSYPFVFEPG